MDSKSIAQMIVDRGNGSLDNPAEPDHEYDADSEPDEGEAAIAEDLMTALETKDVKSFVKSLRLFLQMA